jgi:hypothetical protein
MIQHMLLWTNDGPGEAEFENGEWWINHPNGSFRVFGSAGEARKIIEEVLADEGVMVVHEGNCFGLYRDAVVESLAAAGEPAIDEKRPHRTVAKADSVLRVIEIRENNLTYRMIKDREERGQGMFTVSHTEFLADLQSHVEIRADDGPSAWRRIMDLDRNWDARMCKEEDKVDMCW